MRTIELKQEEVNYVLNYVRLIQHYVNEINLLNMTNQVIKNQYAIFTDGLYEEYKIDKEKETIRFTPDFKSIEVFKKEELEKEENKHK